MMVEFQVVIDKNVMEPMSMSMKQQIIYKCLTTFAIVSIVHIISELQLQVNFNVKLSKNINRKIQKYIN